MITFRRSAGSRRLGVLLGLGIVAGSLVSTLAAPPASKGPGAPPSRPVDVMVAIDNSASMKQHDPSGLTRDLVGEFSDRMGRDSPDARLGVVLFDANAKVLLEPITVTSAGFGAALAGGLRRIDYRGRLTNIPAGVERAVYELRVGARPEAHRVLLLLTDGLIDGGSADRTATATAWLRDQVAPEAKRAGVRIFGVAFSDAADIQLIQSLAQATGGEFWRVRSAADVARIWEGVRSRLGESTPVPPPARPDPKPPWWMPSMGWPEYLQVSILSLVLLCLGLYAVERRRAIQADSPLLSALFSNPYLRIVGILLMLLVVVRPRAADSEEQFWSLPLIVVFIIGATVAGADFILLLVALLKENDVFIKEHFALERQRNRYGLARPLRTPGGRLPGGPGGPPGPSGAGGPGGGAQAPLFLDARSQPAIVRAGPLAPLLVQPELETIGLVKACARVERGRSVRVAVVGAGFDPSLERHPWLAGVLEPAHVIAGAAQGGPGGIGATAIGYLAAVLPDVRILPVVVFDESYTSEDSRVAEGVKVALEWAPDVVLLDFGAPMRNNALSRLIGDNSGSVLFTAPAGNESSSRAVWPAAEDGVLAIAATTARGGLATFCSHGRNVRFAAPGVDLLYLAEARGEELQFLQISGTSAAAAVATAAFSLALAAAGSLRPRALDDAATATGQTVMGHSGIRLIDADELIRRVMRTAESKPEG